MKRVYNIDIYICIEFYFIYILYVCLFEFKYIHVFPSDFVSSDPVVGFDEFFNRKQCDLRCVAVIIFHDGNPCSRRWF